MGKNPESCPTSEDFAIVLGFKKSDSKSDYEGLDEVRKSALVEEWMEILKLEDQVQRMLVYTKYCALYLSQTVKLYANPPAPPSNATAAERSLLKGHDAYLTMISLTHPNPYFAKYLRSNHPDAALGRRLPQIVTERLIQVGPSWDRYMNDPSTAGVNFTSSYFETCAGNVVMLLGSLLSSFVTTRDQNSVVPLPLRARLIPLLNRWASKDKNSYLGVAASRAVSELSINKSEMSVGLSKSLRSAFKNWAICGTRPCMKKDNLKACARCQTVRYCCPEHQRIHWREPVLDPKDGKIIQPSHKELCFATVY